MAIKAFFIQAAAFLLTSLFILLFKRLSLKRNLLIAKGIPLVGGPAIGLSFIVMSLCGGYLFGVFSKEFMGIITGSAVMLLFGIWDDWRELSISAKFLAQFIASAMLIVFGVRTQIYGLGIVGNVIVTMVWMLAITNAINHLDVMDGVAASTAAIICIGFFTITSFQADIKTAVFSLVLLGGICGFLIFNLPPARIYMGNSGSHFLGFALAAIAMKVSYATMETKVALFSPLLILGFPIYDTLFLILMRILNKRIPFKKSNDHMVLRFLALGYGKKKTLSIIIFCNLFFVLSGVFVSRASNLKGAIVISAVIMISLALTNQMRKVSING